MGGGTYADDAGLAISAMEQQLAIMAEWQRSEAQVGAGGGIRRGTWRLRGRASCVSSFYF